MPVVPPLPPPSSQPQQEEEGQQQQIMISNLPLRQSEEESPAAVVVAEEAESSPRRQQDHQQQLLLCAVDKEGETTAVPVAESSSSTTPQQQLQIVGHHPEAPTVVVPAISLSSSPPHKQQLSTLHDGETAVDLDDVSAASEQQKQVMFNEATRLEEALQQKRGEDDAVQSAFMCKSNLLSFNLETSLIRDERKLMAIIKSLPEYVDTKLDNIELEYQGESIEGIFTASADKHHVRGQPIDDTNKNRLMRGLVYYVRQLISSEDEEERATVIILCWTDDAASRSEVFLERVSIDEYLRLLEDGYVC